MMRFLPRIIRRAARQTLVWLWRKSLAAAIREQRLIVLRDRLCVIVPDVSDQYSGFRVQGQWLLEKVRGLHAFQISLVQRVQGKFQEPTIVDIGDSSGTHLRYVESLSNGRPMKSMSVNLDPEAVRRITSKGLEAIHCRAEELDRYNIKTDIFLCFETLEHLPNPAGFLHSLSVNTGASYLILTVPYVKQSRVGLHHIRANRRERVAAEGTHIFELCPRDLRLLAQHAGWAVAYEQIYLQYPRWHPLRVSQPLWARFDCEGFYGMILHRDDTWSKLYADW